MPEITPLLAEQLNVSQTRAYVEQYYPLTEEESRGIQTALHEVIGHSRHASAHGVDGLHVASRGAALQSGRGAPRADQFGVRLLLDEKRGIGVLADSTSPVASTAAAEAFHRAAKLHRFGKYATAREVAAQFHDTTTKTDRVLVKTQQLLGEAEDVGTSVTGFQLLPGGRLAFTHTGDTALYVRDPNGICSQLLEPAGDSRGTVQLQPGRNVILATTASVAPRELNPQERADGIGATIDTLQVGLGHPNSATVIASHLLQVRRETDRDAGALALTVDVAPWEDTRSTWRRWSDYLRPSTLAYTALARWKLQSANARRRLYEEASSYGRAGRVLARSVDVASGITGALLIYALTRSVLAATGVAAPSSNGAPNSLLEAAGAAAPAPETHVTPITSGIEDPLPQPDFGETQVATANDPFSHRAANVTDWSRQALEEYGEQVGMTPKDVQTAQHDPHIVNAINQAFYANNAAVAEHARHWLFAGVEYNRTGQNQAAYEQAMAWQTTHGQAPVPATPVTPTSPPSPGPTNNPQAVTASHDPSLWGSNQNTLLTLAASLFTTIVVATGIAAYRKQRRSSEEWVERRNGGIRSHRASRQTAHRPLMITQRVSADDDDTANARSLPAPDDTDTGGIPRTPSRARAEMNFFADAT